MPLPQGVFPAGASANGEKRHQEETGDEQVLRMRVVLEHLTIAIAVSGVTKTFGSSSSSCSRWNSGARLRRTYAWATKRSSIAAVGLTGMGVS